MASSPRETFVDSDGKEYRARSENEARSLRQQQKIFGSAGAYQRALSDIHTAIEPYVGREVEKSDSPQRDIASSEEVRDAYIAAGIDPALAHACLALGMNVQISEREYTALLVVQRAIHNHIKTRIEVGDYQI